MYTNVVPARGMSIEQSHIAYACVGIFSTLFSLASLFVKERLYIGEATVATIAGLIFGPHCLNWLDPINWTNSDHLTLEICRIVLCIQIVAVAVELPRKYMKKHWLSVTIFLLPVMTCGWLVVGLFIWALIPHFNFADGLLVAACVTATDPVLAAAVVGKGKFAERVPGHLRNLLTAESGCNDGMAFPFIFLALNLVTQANHAREVVKDWFTLTIFWECCFGVVLGVFLGYSLRKAVAFAENKDLIDRESFLALFVFLAFVSAGVGSMLGVDDLLVSFAAGTAFGWNGEFARKTEESHVSTVIDLLLNLSFFVYFGAIVPWPDFNNSDLGLDVWRLIILAFVIIFLRRIPAVLALKPFTPDVKTWREALFCGHFGPIGVGAIFAAILARGDLEAHYTNEETPLANLTDETFPITSSSNVSGLSSASSMAITMTTTNTHDQGPSWMSRLQKLDRTTTSYSLHSIDTAHPDLKPEDTASSQTGAKVRPSGGARRKRMQKKHNKRESKTTDDGRHRPQTEVLQLGKSHSQGPTKSDGGDSGDTSSTFAEKNENIDNDINEETLKEVRNKIAVDSGKPLEDLDPDTDQIPAAIYKEGNHIIVEDQEGEIIQSLPMRALEQCQETPSNAENVSIHSMNSLRRHMSQFSATSHNSGLSSKSGESIGKKITRTMSRKKKAFVKKDGGKKFFAHQVDNLIVIENSDGEVVRRYRVNKHVNPNKQTTRARSGSIVNKALSLVGIKNKEPSPADANAARESALDSPLPVGESEKVVIPHEESPHHDEEKFNNSMQRKLSGLIEAETGVDSNHVVLKEEEPCDTDEYNESEDEETEVEKKRRLAALGQLSHERDASDEER
ncbi:sodium/hydrogen antiporter [Candidozyma duobushaemuli]|uniref:Sodium/hydrogen antiporter n=1 Tax=Candidozyma duobushaemuli TaxID=1231522 RepID=A0A2V1A6F4_9ASCO|nr:sodium/hydrogen antiporter [[Candida] duobushaemulonis]PVH13670.1 sodium/hydrogen antiporter [[Candida] duobushaemulonis]